MSIGTDVISRSRKRARMCVCVRVCVCVCVCVCVYSCTLVTGIVYITYSPTVDAVMDSLLEELTQSDLYKAALEHPEVYVCYKVVIMTNHILTILCYSMTHPLQESCSQIILRMKQLIHK